MSRKVTFIDELPDVEYIDDMDDHSSYRNKQTDKYVRKSHSPPMESGMYPRSSHVNNTGQDRAESDEYPPTYREPKYTPQNMMNTRGPPQNTSQPTQGQPPEKREINCLEVLDHMKNCPICSRYHGGKNDKLPYIIIIAILVIICLMLMKKIIDIYGTTRKY